MARLSIRSRRWRVLRWLAGFGGMVALGACVEQAEDKPTAEDMEFVKKHLLTAAPTPHFAVNADLDGKVTYLGLNVSPNPIEAGKDTTLTHYWKVTAPPGEGWRTFTHLEGPGRQGYINADHGPVRGKYPVTQWKAGDIISDEHVVRLPPTFRSEKLHVYVGLWRRADRMPIKSGPKDGEGRILAAEIPVKGGAPALAAKRYQVRKTGKAIKLDGKLDEAAWKSAPSTGVFVNTMSGGDAEHKAEAKLLWDDKNLYIAFENSDADVWADLSKRDDKLWTQEAVEIMIDADGNGKTYVEFQVAPNGTLFDTYLPEYRKYEDTVDAKAKPFSWNSGIKAAVKVDGTLNNRDDVDKGWVAEIAIPLSDVAGLDKASVKAPAVGDVWRLNLFRLDSPKGKSQQASAWSPPMVGDFHALDKFGEVVFVNEQGEVPAPVVADEEKAPAGTKATGESADKKAMIKAVIDGIQPPPGAPSQAETKIPAAAKAKKSALGAQDDKKQ